MLANHGFLPLPHRTLIPLCLNHVYFILIKLKDLKPNCISRGCTDDTKRRHLLHLITLAFDGNYMQKTHLDSEKCISRVTYQIINIDRIITRSSVDVLLSGAAISRIKSKKYFQYSKCCQQGQLIIAYHEMK